MATRPIVYQGVPVAPWIVPRLNFARHHGWTGVVVSGWRSDADQIAAATRYARELGRPLRSVYPYGPLASNHCGLTLPKGAVDVTQAPALAAAMRQWTAAGKRRPLVWAGPTIGDWVHFSSNGH